MEECTHNCETCSSGCSEKSAAGNSFLESTNELSNVKKIIAVVSGKGGVGKSLVTSMLAVCSNKKGLKTAIIDADITGPSIPAVFGLKEKATGDENYIFPVKSKTGIDIMSVNLLLENDTDPVIWRGPVIAGTVKQFYTNVVWNDIDCMFIDCPPGTGDVPLTIFQSIPVDGIVVVTSPQDLVSMIVKKAVKMAEMMNIPILGIVENMSYFTCPGCGEKHSVFGNGDIDGIAKSFGIKNIAKLPIDPKIARLADSGNIESVPTEDICAFADAIL